MCVCGLGVRGSGVADDGGGGELGGAEGGEEVGEEGSGLLGWGWHFGDFGCWVGRWGFMRGFRSVLRVGLFGFVRWELDVKVGNVKGGCLYVRDCGL